MPNTFARKDYVIREEPFGYIFFDKPRLKHKFVLKADLPNFLNSSRLELEDCEYLKAEREKIFGLILFILRLEYITN
ncbi:hypothetical protein COY48_04125 [Candidatus Collierbacteria bacterium CG_4_10_14_0_8_um_filter_43_86]|uniref:Uncharacterized protein n=2 Tax=Candidatus Collieribacteriota TaxID=1752725 RepID=A0A2H0DUF7_9BACT|nr:MAG: hypothetical protein COW83_02340 [Candidatus Collierbacteria bacterium CG22_combo_CG10-13_8_21_14_all_43_12]PIZ24226.1 MAG: hypothetical protein COY48_04125 [Candidatus Collierbacteria bacterium CG_4_10_14_0_8_um_filter_43_86]PJB48019.1 MAG: hypothetical protein CO104_02250 [Candidatus Collierbacteria bacterium CG_4_9_14_3_um_filter_43_16]